MTDILGSALLATLLSSIVTYIITRRQESLQYITSDRREWREKIREIAEKLNGASYKDTMDALAELKVRINAFGSQGKQRRYQKDFHIWELIRDMEKEEPPAPKLKQMQSQMIQYLSFLLKYDWERSKKEVKGNVFQGISIVSNIIILGIFSCYYYQKYIGTEKSEQIEDIFIKIGVFVVIYVLLIFLWEFLYRKMVENGIELPKKGRYRNSFIYSVACVVLLIAFVAACNLMVGYMLPEKEENEESIRYILYVMIIFGQGINCMSKIGKIQLETDYTCAIDEEREKFLRDSVPDINQSVRENGVWNHNFDFSKEITMYSFLCEEGKKREKKKYRNLQENEKFYTYAGWKAYIKNKYSCYPVEGLKEFSRYLNHKRRIYPSSRDYLNSTIPSVLSAAVTFFISKFVEINQLKFETIIGNVLVLLVSLVLAFFMGILIFRVAGMYTENSFKKNFFRDYKEIIDKIIYEKEAASE